jgi:hypothetical protein
MFHLFSTILNTHMFYRVKSLRSIEKGVYRSTLYRYNFCKSHLINNTVKYIFSPYIVLIIFLVLHVFAVSYIGPYGEISVDWTDRKCHIDATQTHLMLMLCASTSLNESAWHPCRIFCLSVNQNFTVDVENKS